MKRLNDTQQGSGLALIGFVLTCLYALTKIHAPDDLSNSIGFPMVLLGFFAIYQYGKGLSVRVPMLLFLAAAIIPLLSWYFAHLAHPTWVNPYPRLDKLTRIFIFIPIAWWLKDSPRKVLLFWALATLTIVAAPWISGGGWAEIEKGLHGTRINYGLRNGQHASLFFGIVLIGLICFAPRILKWKKQAIVIWVPVLCFSLFTIAASLVRACWLALIVTTIVTAIYFLISKQKTKFRTKYTAIIALIIFITGFAIYQSMGHIIGKRAETESGVIQHILKGDLENVPYTSIGIRIHMWRASWEKIKEHPLLGWGENGQDIAIQDTNWIPQWVKQNFGHIHNNYIALLTDYGIVGFIFYFIWVGWLLIKFFKAIVNNYISGDFGYFTLAVFTFWSVMGLFESYLFFWTGVFCLQVIFGGLLGLIWHAQIQEKEKQKEIG